MDKGKKTNWRNSSLLSAIPYPLHTITWSVLDHGTARQLSEVVLVDYMMDSLSYMFFTYTLLGFYCIVFNVFSFKVFYVRVIIYASCLLVLNSLVALGMISLSSFLWSGARNSIFSELLNMKSACTFVIIATFLSSVYASALYLQPYIKVRGEERTLEMALTKEKGIALQS